MFCHLFSSLNGLIAFNVAVYGVLRHTQGRLSLNYTIDNGVAETREYFNSTQPVNATKYSFQKLYEHSFSPDQRLKNHKLEVTLAACTDDQVCRLFSTCFPLRMILMFVVVSVQPRHSISTILPTKRLTTSSPPSHHPNPISEAAPRWLRVLTTTRMTVGLAERLLEPSSEPSLASSSS